jgi:hypothetical protein
MPRYRVPIRTGITGYVIVDADNADDALEEALQDPPTICAQCSGWGSDKYSLELDEEWTDVDAGDPIVVDDE